MKSPLWILNSAFTVLFLISLLLVFFMRVQIPVRTALTPQIPSAVHDSDSSKVNPVLIYENDLFGTIVKPVEVHEEEPEVKEIVIPALPPMVAGKAPGRSQPEFLPPLQIKLRGVVFNTNSLYSRAIVINTKTNAEALYRIGDKIEDATLIHIGKKKAVFVRPNGQQETMFISEDDAQKDPLYMGDRAWATNIIPLNSTTFRIDGAGFKKHITSVAQLLDQLDITPAIEDGKNLGCRIGQLAPQSIGTHIGLKKNDIITDVNGIKPTSTKNRVALFKAIKQAGINQKITVTLTRAGSPIELTYFVQPVTNEDEEEIKAEEKTSVYERKLPSGIMLDRSQSQLPPISSPFPSPSTEPIPIPNAIAGPTRLGGVNNRTLVPDIGQEPVENAFRRRDKKSMLGYGSRSAFLQR